MNSFFFNFSFAYKGNTNVVHHTHTHTYIYIYIYIYMSQYVSVDIVVCIWNRKRSVALFIGMPVSLFIDRFGQIIWIRTVGIIHKENPTRGNSVSTFYFIFIWSLTCLGRHTAHHQEPKIAIAASGFAYVEGCWTCSCWTLSASSNHTSNNPLRLQNYRLLVQL
jgi:hypothetical protein